MSCIDTTDFDYSLGFLALHQRTGGITSYSPQQDRRQSLGIPSYPLGISRSLGAHERELTFGGDDVANRHNPSSGSNAQISLSSLNPNTTTHRPSPPLPQHATHLYSTSAPADTDILPVRNSLHQPSTNSPPNLSSSRSTLWWGELEPWMDEEYVKQVCTLMNWDPANIRVPRPPPDPITGHQGNNPGYCFLTFPTAAHAASVLSQINNSGNGNSIIMPNSSKPFIMNWASNVPSASPVSYPPMPPVASNPTPPQQYQKEYSIFVGDLAPETSNSDLVAVFRNPVLGLRNDREPKFIRPFLSCKSAKIMLDPVTGVSRGYGFVRFTDEADQQRALIEMHGLYCLSRPMRISPATAKYKPPPSLTASDLPQVQYPLQNPVTLALPLTSPVQNNSVCTPIASITSNSSLVSNAVSSSSSGTTLGGSNSGGSLSSSSTSNGSLPSPFHALSSEEMMKLPNAILAQIAQQYATSDTKGGKPNVGASVTSSFVQDSAKQNEENGHRYSISEESWKHHAQARAILGNLIGPNGEQLTSTDPYNTTVFVGGLSPLISEETLRTFFAPFGDIHYVKVPAGKHCGFVQFVRKADAERAIEKMQGFPIGGSRIRLSWGRSQYKAAQAAAQAAQAAALQAQYQATITQSQSPMTHNPLSLNAQYNAGGVNSGAAVQRSYAGSSLGTTYSNLQVRGISGSHPLDAYLLNGLLPQANESQRIQSNFSPFSPDPNIYESDGRRNDSNLHCLPHASNTFSPGFFSMQPSDLKPAANSDADGNSSLSDPHSGTSSNPRYGNYLDATGVAYSSRRTDVVISRPSSGSTSGTVPERDTSHNSDLLQDLNGTLASLDLDREKQWKPQLELLEKKAQPRPSKDIKVSP